MVAPNSNALDRMLGPVVGCFTRESAERLLTLEIDEETRAKIAELARKSNEGVLSEAERAEYLDYVEAMDLIGILQGKARQVVLGRNV
jgi:hypothetical protein